MTTKTFKRYTIDEYMVYLQTFVDKVFFTEVHVHGTWMPDFATYYAESDKEDVIYNMWNFHTGTKGWADIAQHASIDPDGYIWAGRPLLTPPASATDHNDSDNDGQHPFMFEMIGNFDKGRDILQGKQLNAAVRISAAILRLWKRPLSSVHFHRDFTNLKTCPGSGIEKSWFVGLVDKEGKQKMTADDANAIINKFLKPAYGAAKTDADRKEVGRLADSLRVASGQPKQNG